MNIQAYYYFHLVKSLKTLDLYKALNLFKLVLSYGKALLLKNTKTWGLPVALSIEPTNTCNLACPDCITGNQEMKRPKGVLSLKSFTLFLSRLPRSIIYLNLCFQGEPFANPSILSMIKEAKKKKLYCALSTNGHFNPAITAKGIICSGLDEITFSLDGTSQITYALYRKNGDFDKVIKTIRELIKQKRNKGIRKPFVKLQFIVFRHNEDEIKKFEQLAKTLKVDQHVIKSAHLHDPEKEQEKIPRQKRYARYYVNKRGFVEKLKRQGPCWKAWHSAVVTWQGDVLPCCIDKNGDHVFGNLHEKNLEQVWSGGAFNAFREQLLKNQVDIDICKKCSM